MYALLDRERNRSTNPAALHNRLFLGNGRIQDNRNASAADALYTFAFEHGRDQNSVPVRNMCSIRNKAFSPLFSGV